MIDNLEEEYFDSYVAFLDVLGFTKMVIGNESRKLTTYFNQVQEVISELKKIDEKKEIGNIVISDSIILTIKKERCPESNLNILRQLCIAVSKIQRTLSLKDIWIRGAISSGKTYFNQTYNQIVGPAYIQAYNLEKDYAIYPRVILDNKIFLDLNIDNSADFIAKINGLNEEDVLYDWSKDQLVSNYRIQQDLLFFIDFYSSVYSTPEELAVVLENIKTNLYSMTGLSKKYRWLIDYLYSIALRSENNGRECVSVIKNELKKL